MCDSNSKPKFKAGDKVKCIQAAVDQYIKKGEVYTIQKVINNGYGEYLELEEIKKGHDYAVSRFELIVDIPQPKFKVGDKVKTLYGEFEVLWVGNLSYSGKQGYVCYKEGFNGHSAKATVGSDIFENTKYKGQCWNFSEDELELVVKENCKQTHKNYRELTPDALLDISIDGNEFKVPLGDLIHTKALVGVANGWYGGLFYKALKDIFDKDGVIYNSHEYGYIDTSDTQRALFKSYFIDKEKEAKKQALKDVIGKQREELANLEKELYKLDES